MKALLPLCLLVFVCACGGDRKDADNDVIVSPAAGPQDTGLTVISSSITSANTGSEVFVCTRAAIDSGNGWGWENGQSCMWPGAVEVGAAHAPAPQCSALAANHGDGWGFENGVSCQWGESTGGRSEPIECSTSALDHGDGWGWDNGQSCRWGDSTAVSSSSSSSNTIVVGQPNNNGECSASALDTGGGWGWEYGAPCQWGSVAPNSSVGAVWVPGPVRARVPGYSQGKPICLTDGSDGNQDGFGYEDNQTCTVVEGVTATSEKPLLNTRWCQPWAEIHYGDYALQNNTWNDSEVYSNNWHQCIELTGNESRYIAKWDYNWLDKNRGNEFSVKSYPQVYYGRKTRNSISGSTEKLGLPAPLYQLPNFKVRYKYSETGNPERNVALESFFHTSCEAEEWNKQFEMMVWVGVPVTRGPGPKVAEVTIDGVGWNVHTNPSLGWGYVAFVAQRPRQEGWLDWNKFVDWVRYNGSAYGVPRIQNNTCMGAIEIGTETFWGQGTFTLHEFEVVKN